MRKKVQYSFQVIASLEENSLVAFESNRQIQNDAAAHHREVSGTSNSTGVLNMVQQRCVRDNQYVIQEIFYTLHASELDSLILNLIV